MSLLLNSRKKVSVRAALVLMVFLLLIIGIPMTSAQDSDNDGIEDSVESNLAEKYAPILIFEEEEVFFPVVIGYHLNNSNLNQSRDEDDLIDPDPTIEEIGNYTDPEAKYYLDNRIGNVSNDAIEKDYVSKKETLGYCVYSRVVGEHFEAKDYIIVQYWIFYAFNKGPLNTHEGDWEMVQVALDPSKEPEYAMYSQHTEGEKTEWSNVEKDGDHMKVYVARGSHANYFRSYQGKLSLANDDVDDKGEKLDYGDYTIVLLGELGDGNHSADQDWLDFAGRWGEYGSDEDELRGKRGSYGPAYREDGEMWNTPMTWGNGLRSVDENMFRLNWFFYNFVMIFIVVAIITLLVKLVRINHRRKKTGLGKRISAILYIDGLNLKSFGNIFCIIGIIFAILALFEPWYVISIDITSGDYKTDGFVDVVTVDGTDGVMVNTLESNSGMLQLFAFPLPFSLLIGIAIFFLILSTIGMKESKMLGSKYLWYGIKFAIPIIVIVIFISQTNNLMDLAPVDLEDDEIQELVDTVSGSPIGGEKEATIGEYGDTNVKWGIEQGGWYLIISAGFLILGGIMEMLYNKDIFKVCKKIKAEKTEKKEENSDKEAQEGEKKTEEQEKPPETEKPEEEKSE